MKKLFLLCVCLLTASLLPLQAKELVLAGKTVAPATIFIPKEPSPVICHAAEELALYLGKITNTAPPAVSQEGGSSRCAVFLLTADQAKKRNILPEKKLAELADDGFLLHVSGNKLYVIGSNPLGVLYGAYEVVKRYGKIRFLSPGKDGEYYTEKASISIPEGTLLCNPAFPYRNVFLGRSNRNFFAKDTWDWEVRNNLRVRVNSSRFGKEALDYLEKLDAFRCNGGHVFSHLLVSRECNPDCTMEELFEKHPDIFPLINGKRTMLEGQKYQPCTSNPKTLQRMRQGVIRFAEKRARKGDVLLLGNNDGTSWCQCENCRKLDPPEEKAAGSVATRYWLLVNDLAKAVWEKHPGIRIQGWAYQNFHQVPKGVLPDPRLEVLLAWNNLCFRHEFTDPNCPMNRSFAEKLREWGKLKNPLVIWNETTYAAADNYLPMEKIFLKSVKEYGELGAKGPLILASAPDSAYPEKYVKTLTPVSWHAMWCLMYLSARTLWEKDLDYEKELQEAYQLYYGAAWKSMMEYHLLREKGFLDLPICFAMGLNAPVGRCLEQPGMEEKILKKLQQAKKEAADDPRALKHIDFDERFFREVWMQERKNYLSGLRELKSLPRQGKIVIDGVDAEEDWKKAERVTGFRKQRSFSQNAPENARVQTFFRVVYEPEYLYFHIEAMEPQMDQIKAEYTARDSHMWKDNHIEIFINHFNIGKSYFHYAINHNGVLYDAFCDGISRGGDKSYQSALEAKTILKSDRWCVEVKIPTAELGFKCTPGSSWKINIGRTRALKDGTVENSSIANGAFHYVDNFLPVFFTQKGVQNGREVDVSPWKNGSFETIVPYGKAKIKEWTVKDGKGPLNWSFLTRTGSLEVCRYPDRNARFLKLSGGGIYQFYRGEAPSFSIRFKASGNGTLNVRLLRKKPLPGNKQTGLPTKQLKKIRLDSPEWKEYSIQWKREIPEELDAPVFECLNGSVSLDEIMIVPEQ